MARTTVAELEERLAIAERRIDQNHLRLLDRFAVRPYRVTVTVRRGRAMYDEKRWVAEYGGWSSEARTLKRLKKMVGKNLALQQLGDVTLPKECKEVRW